MIYVASSVRNPWQPTVVSKLKEAGHRVYDFRQPTADDRGFEWTDIDPDWQLWSPRKYLFHLRGSPEARNGYRRNMEAMQSSDTCVLVLPCGRSAHLEAGWFVGAGRKLWILLDEDVRVEPELMYRMATGICVGLDDLIERLTSQPTEEGGAQP